MSKQQRLLEYSPCTGKNVFGTITAKDYRRTTNGGIWSFNPWSGLRRDITAIATDPTGLLIIAPWDGVLAPHTLAPGTIDATLAERGTRYGVFSEHARITQALKRAMIDSPNWAKLGDDKKEALEMVAHKVGRILNGDPDYHDSWHDMIGYTKLVADTLEQAS